MFLDYPSNMKKGDPLTNAQIPHFIAKPPPANVSGFVEDPSDNLDDSPVAATPIIILLQTLFVVESAAYPIIILLHPVVKVPSTDSAPIATLLQPVVTDLPA